MNQFRFIRILSPQPYIQHVNKNQIDRASELLNEISEIDRNLRDGLYNGEITGRSAYDYYKRETVEFNEKFEKRLEIYANRIMRDYREELVRQVAELKMGIKVPPAPKKTK